VSEARIGNLKPGERAALGNLLDDLRKEKDKASDRVDVMKDVIVDLMRENPSVAEEVLLKRIGQRVSGKLELPEEMDVQKTLIERGAYKLGTGTGHVTQTNQPAKPPIPESVLVKIQNVHDYFMEHGKEHKWDELASFVCAKLPFPKILFSADPTGTQRSRASRQPTTHNVQNTFDSSDGAQAPSRASR